MELRKRLSDFLQAWGLSAAPVRRESSVRAAVDIILDLTSEDPLLVGTLSAEGGQYTFRYSEVFKRRLDIPAISAFPNRDEVYRSSELWPFFQVRLPPLDRADVRRVVEERNLDKDDLMSLLPALGGHVVTSPYNLVPHGPGR
jgi:HipA-like protein